MNMLLPVLNHDLRNHWKWFGKVCKNGRHAALTVCYVQLYTDLKRYDEAEQAANAFNASDNADYSYLDYRYWALLSA